MSPVGEAGAVVEAIPGGDELPAVVALQILIVCVFGDGFGEIGEEGFVQVELPFIDELHDQVGEDGFGKRSGVETGSGVVLLPGGGALVSVSLHVGDGVCPDHTQAEAGDAGAIHQLFDGTVDGEGLPGSGAGQYQRQVQK